MKGTYAKQKEHNVGPAFQTKEPIFPLQPEN